MLKYRYKFLPTQPKEVVEQDSFNPADSLLLEDFKVNNNFDQANDYIELHYYTLDGRILKSIPNYILFVDLSAPMLAKLLIDNGINVKIIRRR